MVTLLNRKELMVVVSMEKRSVIRQCLAQAGIESDVKTIGALAAAEQRRSGMFGITQDCLYTWRIFVKKEDYDRAEQAIRPALRGGQ